MKPKIIQAAEVVYFTGGGSPDAFSALVNATAEAEQSVFVKYLGLDFWESMQADLKPSPAYSEWQQGVSYNAGQIVLYQGLFWEATALTTGRENPLNEGHFSLWPKFLEPGYNHIFQAYIGPAIAHKAVAAAALHRTIQITEKGFQTADTDYTQAASQQQIAMMMKRYETIAENQLSLLQHYLSKPENKGLPIYAHYLPISKGENNLTTTRKRRGHGFHW